VTFVLALWATAAGIAALYGSWRRPHRFKTLTASGAWLIVGASTVLWTRAAGPELGTACASMAVGVMAWMLVAVGRERAAGRRAQIQAATPRPDRGTVARAVARTIVAVPLAGGAALTTGAAISVAVPGAEANRIALAFVLATTLWGALAVWAAAACRLRRPALVLAGMTAVASAALAAR
jgi:hypothetical protein